MLVGSSAINKNNNHKRKRQRLGYLITVLNKYQEQFSLFSFIDRISKGEDAVLTKERPHLLAVTSGTTGPGCMIPRIPSQGYPFFVGRAAITNAMYTVYPEVH